MAETNLVVLVRGLPLRIVHAQDLESLIFEHMYSVGWVTEVEEHRIRSWCAWNNNIKMWSNFVTLVRAAVALIDIANKTVLGVIARATEATVSLIN